MKRCERGAEGECRNVAWQVGEEAFSFEEWKSGLCTLEMVGLWDHRVGF
jgi:hypothetical protein